MQIAKFKIEKMRNWENRNQRKGVLFSGTLSLTRHKRAQLKIRCSARVCHILFYYKLPSDRPWDIRFQWHPSASHTII